MTRSGILAEAREAIAHIEPMEHSGRVVQARGLAVRAEGLSLPIGAMVRIESRGTVDGQVIGFDEEGVIVLPLGDTAGIRRGDAVVAMEMAPVARVGDALLGRVVNALGRPIDGRGPLMGLMRRPLSPPPIEPMARGAVEAPLPTGVRAIDTMLTLGRGQRVGIFSGPGLGKTTLLGMMARGVASDVCVIALIGERGREVRQFVERNLGDTGLSRSVVVAAASDEPALMRLRAALQACAVAEHFRDRGLHVLFVMDSVTRFAQAARQVGLAAGEPPAVRGYPPSVFASVPCLLERGGACNGGSITGLYSVLVEGDDPAEPVAEACRGGLDGHITLSRTLAEAGHWPAIDVGASVSRAAMQVCDEPHRLARGEILRLISEYRQVEELLRIGAYAAGASPLADLAIEMKPQIDAMLTQGMDDRVAFDEAKAELFRVTMHATRLAARVRRPTHGG
jgi:flagellum-specific ATP synthase